MSDTKTGGRPRRGDEPEVDARALEQLLVHGEWITDERARVVHRYPSYRDLAARFGVTKTVIHRFARRHNCLERRAGSGAEVQPPTSPSTPDVRSSAPETPPSEPSGETDSRPPADDVVDARMLPTIRDIFVTWVRAVKAGEIRIASAGEIEKMLRIAADLDAEAQMRALIPEGILTLDELQDLYEARKAAYEASSPAERGEIPIGIPGCDVVYDAPRSEDDGADEPSEGEHDEC